MADSSGVFHHRYGPWGVVAGASQGLGAAFSRFLARAGINVVLVARDKPALEGVGAELVARYGVQVRLLSLDLAEPGGALQVAAGVDDIDIGLLVCNAAFSLIGPFLDRPPEEHLREIDLNCRAPLVLASALGRRMRERGSGGIVLMSSLSALQGSPLIANYAATKAYNRILAEGLWYELRAHGIDVLASCAGATNTPNYTTSGPSRSGGMNVSTMEPDTVVVETFKRLGKQPSMVPGRSNRAAAFVLERLLPRKMAVRFMGRTLQAIYPGSPLGPDEA